ncbi:MAG: hypothetical protein AB1898_24480 [Acidobacteriota bacterium]
MNRLAGGLALLLTLPMLCGSDQGGRSAQHEFVSFAFDDHAIPWRHNLKLTLVQADKHPENPVLRRGSQGSPDWGHAILYGSVIHVGGKFRMWYLGMIQHEITERSQAPGWWRPMCYAESDDGVHWNKPELGLVELNGNKRNNICLVESEPASLSRVNDFLTVLYEPDDPDPSRRYKVAFIAYPLFEEVRGGRSRIGPDESRFVSFVAATSADGLRWRVVGDRPMNSGGERFEVSGLYRFGDFYFATGQLFSPWTWLPDGRDVGRVMLAYRSPDFTTWSKATALAFARPGQMTSRPLEGQQTHMGAGLWNRENVLVGLYGMWQDGPSERPKGAHRLYGTRIDLGLIVSNDGIHFREPVPDFKVIPHGKEGEWDCVSILQGHAFANVGDKTYIWYAHWDNHMTFRNQDIGLATLRRDGFGYLSRKERREAGHCITTTVPASSLGYRIKVNVEDVSPEAPLTVELLDKSGRPLAGFSGKDAARVIEPGVDRSVVWPSQPGWRTPRDEAFALQINFPATGDVRLYAAYATPAETHP